jgi:phosphate transport system substrate-binding protein
MRVTMLASQLKRWKSAVGAILVLLTAVGCSSSPSTVAPAMTAEPSAQLVLKMSGSTSAVAIMKALQPAFEADKPGNHLELLAGSGSGSSSTPAVEGVAKKVLDVAVINRQLTDEEAAQGVEYTQFGSAAVAVFTHPALGITSLTKQQVAAIFAGKLTNWSEVGGPNLPIVVFVRTEDNSTTKSMRKAIFGATPFAKNGQLVDKSTDLQVSIEGTPGSIGYSVWPNLLVSNAKVHAIALDGATPSDPAYSVVQPLAISYRSDAKARIQPLADWLLSEQGKATLHKYEVITAW